MNFLYPKYPKQKRNFFRAHKRKISACIFLFIALYTIGHVLVIASGSVHLAMEFFSIGTVFAEDGGDGGGDSGGDGGGDSGGDGGGDSGGGNGGNGNDGNNSSGDSGGSSSADGGGDSSADGGGDTSGDGGGDSGADGGGDTGADGGGDTSGDGGGDSSSDGDGGGDSQGDGGGDNQSDGGGDTSSASEGDGGGDTEGDGGGAEGEDGDGGGDTEGDGGGGEPEPGEQTNPESDHGGGETPPGVTPAVLPWCSLSVSPVSIFQGESALLTWNSTNATEGTINNGIGIVAPSGSQTVSPSVTTTYLGSFRNTSESTLCQTVLAVQTLPQPLAVSCSASPTTATTGENITWSAQPSGGTGSYTYSWSGTNDLAGTAQSFETSYATAGTKTATVAVTSGSETANATCNASITNTPQPPTPSCSMNASPSSITKGDNATLSWTSSNVSSASINNSIGNVSTTGSVSVAPTSNITYTATFTGDHGTATCEASITVNPPGGGGGGGNPPLCTLTLTPSTISTGGSAMLAWFLGNNAIGSIDNGIGNVSTNGSQTVTPGSNTTYTGTFSNSDGTITCQASLSIETGGGGGGSGGGGGGGGGSGGGGYSAPSPNISVRSELIPAGNYVYLSQVPYTGIGDTIWTILAFLALGGASGLIAYKITSKKKIKNATPETSGNAIRTMWQKIRLPLPYVGEPRVRVQRRTVVIATW